MLKQKKGDITKAFNKISREESIILQFQKLASKVKTNSELREIEMRLLKPEIIPEYRGKKAIKNAFKQKTILFVFPNKSFIKRIMKFFKINAYGGYNTYDIDFIIELISLMEKGRIKWNKERKKFYFIQRNKTEIKL